jgi:hypothetical protein
MLHTVVQYQAIKEAFRQVKKLQGRLEGLFRFRASWQQGAFPTCLSAL